VGGGSFGVFFGAVGFKASAAAIGEENQINKFGGGCGGEIVRHGSGLSGGGAGDKAAKAGNGCAVIAVGPLQRVVKRERVVHLVKSVALGLIPDKAGGCGADAVGCCHVVGSCGLGCLDFVGLLNQPSGIGNGEIRTINFTCDVVRRVYVAVQFAYVKLFAIHQDNLSVSDNGIGCGCSGVFGASGALVDDVVFILFHAVGSGGG